MPSIVLRRAVSEDREVAFAIRERAFRAYVEDGEGWNAAEERRNHDRRFDTQEFSILEIDGRDVGVMALSRAPDAIALHQLMIPPEFQGHGYGTAVMDHLLAEASAAELPIRLRVLKSNPRARAFYERLGFVSLGKLGAHDLLEWRPGNPRRDVATADLVPSVAKAEEPPPETGLPLLALLTVSLAVTVVFASVAPIAISMMFLPLASFVGVALTVIVVERPSEPIGAALARRTGCWLGAPLSLNLALTLVAFVQRARPTRGGDDPFYFIFFGAFCCLIWSVVGANAYLSALRKRP